MKLIYLLLIVSCLAFVGCKKENGFYNPYLDRMQKLENEARANPSDKAALKKLESQTTDSDYWNRVYAYSCLGELAKDNVGNYRDEILPYFDKMLKDSDGGIRRIGAEKLLDMPSAIDKLLPTLLNIVQQGKEDDVTWFSTEALGKLENQKESQAVMPILLKAANKLPPEGTPDEAPQVRYEALDSIIELAKKNSLDAIPDLEKLLDESKSPYKERVAKTILELNPTNEAAKKALNSSAVK
jgi:hypothetical protein